MDSPQAERNFFSAFAVPDCQNFPRKVDKSENITDARFTNRPFPSLRPFTEAVCEMPGWKWFKWYRIDPRSTFSSTHPLIELLTKRHSPNTNTHSTTKARVASPCRAEPFHFSQINVVSVVWNDSKSMNEIDGTSLKRKCTNKRIVCTYDGCFLLVAYIGVW